VTAATVSDTSSSVSWRSHGLALLLLLGLILFEFRDAVVAAAEVWWVYETYSHCFLIIPISLWFVWEKRAQLSQLQPTVEPRALWALPVLVFAWWVGELSTINELRQFAVVGLLQVAIAAMLGFRVYRQIWFSALYLFFLVPTGQYLVVPMQHFAAQFVDVSLNLLQIPHHREGTLFELSNGSYEIAEACAGLRFLIATVALGVLFAYMMFRKWYKVVLFLIACVLIPLIGNGLRCVGIILLAHFTSNAYGAGADHLVYGWGFNVAILLVLFFLGSLFRDSIGDHKILRAEGEKADTAKRVLFVFALSALLTSFGPALAYWHDTHVVAPDVSSLTRALVIPDWQVSEMASDWQPDYPGTDAHLARALTPVAEPPAPPVELYVAYYAQARTGHVLTAHINHLWNGGIFTQTSSGSAIARLDGQKVLMQEVVLSSPAGRRIIWSSYWVDGTFTSSLLKIKLLQARSGLEGHEGQALVALSTVINSTDDEARARLANAARALKDLPQRLNATNHR
jgi:exosortase A